MKCSFCDRRAVYYAPHFNRLFGASHLENFLLKKLKREIYRHRLVKPRDTFLFLSNFSPASEAALYLFSRAVRNWPVRLFAVSLNPFENVGEWRGEKFTKVVDPVTLEGEVKRSVFSLAHGRIYPAAYSHLHVIRPFRAFSQKSLGVLALVRKLKFLMARSENFLLRYAGEALNLNFLRAYDSIMELLHQQKSRRGEEGKR